MKLNLKIFKKGKPIYWIIGGIVLFVLFYWFINRGASGSGGVSYVNSGPSDASVAASTALAAHQSDNSAQVAIATLAYQGNLAQTQAQADAAKYVANLDAATQSKYLDTQIALAAVDKEYGIATATIAANTQHDLALMQKQTVEAQLLTNAQMFETQSKALTYSVLASQISSVKPNDRDNAFALLTGAISGTGISYHDRSSGSFTTTPSAGGFTGSSLADQFKALGI